MSKKQLTETALNDIISTLDTLEALAGQSSRQNRHVDHEIASVIKPLLKAEGYEIEQETTSQDSRVDVLGTRSDGDTLVIENKFYSTGRPVGQDVIEQTVRAANLQDARRAIVISNTGFTQSAEDLVRRDNPINIQLLDFNALRGWAKRLHDPDEAIEREVSRILRETSQRLAAVIARDGNALASMEWRDVERLIAEVFDGLGFKSELTPSSKDGGKDVIASCQVKGNVATYYVEIKHWRSATRVGSNSVQDLLSVVVSENASGGLFLSTYGFTSNAFQSLTCVEREKLRFGDQDKIVTLCKTYMKAKSGIWAPPEDLSELIMGEAS